MKGSRKLIVRLQIKLFKNVWYVNLLHIYTVKKKILIGGFKTGNWEVEARRQFVILHITSAWI